MYIGFVQTIIIHNITCYIFRCSHVPRPIEVDEADLAVHLMKYLESDYKLWLNSLSAN